MSRRPLAILTGATGGIGAALAPRLVQRGFHLLLIARNPDNLDSLARQLAPHATALPFDLTYTDALGSALQPYLHSHAPVHLLINNAGSAEYQPFLHQSTQRHDQLLQLNYLAPAQLTRLVLPVMLDQHAGHIINIASVAATVGPWGHAGYASAKAALVSLTQTLAAEHADTHIHFTSVNPGIVDTAFFHQPHIEPLWRRVRRRAISPQRVADRIIRLLDRPRLTCTIPRHYRILEALHALSPALAHRLVARQSRPSEHPHAPAAGKVRAEGSAGP